MLKIANIYFRASYLVALSILIRVQCAFTDPKIE
jgi:hypothetical protein